MATPTGTFTLTSIITGYHVYNTIWTPKIDEELRCRREPANPHDRFAVAKNETVVGHVPRQYAKTFNYFLKRGGSIVAKVIGPRQAGNGLEIPAEYTFTGQSKDTKLLPVLLKKSR